MATRTKPRRADEHLTWLRGQYKSETCFRPEGALIGPPLAALTGTDYKALEAIDRAWVLFSYTRSARVLTAIALLVGEMQPHMRPLARELAAKAMDWSDRARYWSEVERLIKAPRPVPTEVVCSYCHAQGYHKDHCARPEAKS